MANNVSNHIKVYGNEDAKTKWSELLKDFNNYKPVVAKTEYEDNSVYAIPEILFADASHNQDKKWFNDHTGAKWVKPEYVDGETLILTSAWSGVFPLIRHITKILGAIDSDVVVTHYYEDENPLFIGCSVGIMQDGDVFLAGDEEDVSDIRVVYSKEELVEYEESPDDDVEAEVIVDIIKRLKEEVVDQLEFLPKKRFAEIKKVIKKM